MNFIADTHCHTIASSHAYSTVFENAAAAREAGLKILAITDHGIEMPDAPHIWHFENYDCLPKVMNNVVMLYGVEANIKADGSLDMPEHILKKMDWVIASYHTPVCPPPGTQNATDSYIKIAENPYVDVIGHSGQPQFAYDYEKAIKVFKEYEKIVEINEGSFRVRPKGIKNCAEIAKLCKKYKVKIAVNSDAHYAGAIGNFKMAVNMLDEIDFPEDLIINANIDLLTEHIYNKKGINLKNYVL